MWPKHALMVTPDHFEIAYAINPHMVDTSGTLNKINKQLAIDQWHNLKKTFESLGLQVSVFKGQPDLPDMVFCANPIFPFYKNNRTHFISSNMRSPFRTPEVKHFETSITKNNHELYKLPEALRFEGMGDALWNYDTSELFGGYGFRSDKAAYDLIEDITGTSITRLQLINENFYHMDTALCLIDKDTALVVAEAFAEDSLILLKKKFKNIILIPVDEAKNYLAANACCVDGQNIIIEKNAVTVRAQLQKLGYTTHSVDTSEYIKSGGSLFCMKLLMWDELKDFDNLSTSETDLALAATDLSQDMYSFL